MFVQFSVSIDKARDPLCNDPDKGMEVVNGSGTYTKLTYFFWIKLHFITLKNDVKV